MNDRLSASKLPRVMIDLSPWEFPAVLTVTQDDDPIRDLLHFRQAVLASRPRYYVLVPAVLSMHQNNHALFAEQVADQHGRSVWHGVG